jgi:hypothetical protein
VGGGGHAPPHLTVAINGLMSQSRHCSDPLAEESLRLHDQHS